MGPRARLSEAALHYPPGAEVATAASGRVDALACLYLELDYGDVRGLAEARVNVAYLTGVSPEALRAEAVARLSCLRLSDDPAADRARVDALLPDAAPAVRVLLEAALADAAARREGRSLAAGLGGPPGAPEHATNQTVFVSDPETALARARAHAARGFGEIKLRLGAGDPRADLSLVAAVRAALGETVRIAADVNGAWDRETFAAVAPRLAELGLAYVEQPLPAGDEEGLVEEARTAPVPVMLDESVKTADDLERLLRTGAPFLFHLKLAKLGGLDRLAAAAGRVRTAGHGFMVGQMNEGAAATAAAVALAAALAPDFAELYGADGLLDDPAGPLRYEAGRAIVGGPVGLGVDLVRPTRTLATSGETE